jgi:hypothetical protein
MSIPPSNAILPPSPQGYFSRFRMVLILSFPAGLLFCFLLSAVITYVMPKLYESYVVIQVTKKSDNTKKFDNSVRFFINDFQASHRQEIYQMISKRLRLNSRWGMTDDEVIKYLDRSISLHPVKGKDLALITVKMTGPVDARDVALEYYAACKHFDPSEIGVQELEKEMQDQLSVVQYFKQKVEDLKNIPIELPLPPEVEKVNAQADYAALSKVESVDGRLQIATQRIKEKNIVKVVNSQYLAEGEKLNDLGALKGMNDDDPRYQKQQKKVMECYIYLLKVLNSYQKSLQIRANGGNSDDAKLANQQKVLYAEADLLEKEQLAEQMNKELTEQKSILADSRISMKLHQKPEVSQFAVWPIVDFNLMVGLTAGVTIFPLLVFLLTGLYHVIFPSVKTQSLPPKDIVTKKPDPYAGRVEY